MITDLRTYGLSAFALIFSYFWVNSQINPIKADWDNKKCHPAVIPFAGYINSPPGKTVIGALN